MDTNLTNVSLRTTRDEKWVHYWYTALHYVLLTIIGMGCLLNCIVFVRIVCILRRGSSLTPAWTLFFMCIADVACLLCLGTFSLASDKIFALGDEHEGAKDLYCKLVIYIVHTASAFCVWCWVALSTLRYMAIFHPILYTSHLRLRRPMPILLLTGLTCAGLESWILGVVQYWSERRTCGEIPQLSPSTIRWLHLFEISWTYYLPVCLLTFLDLNVLCRSPQMSLSRTITLPIAAATARANKKISNSGGSTLKRRNSMTRSRRIHSTRRRRQQLEMLKRYLFVTTLDLALNLPSCTLRFFRSFQDGPADNVFLDHILPGIAHVLYHCQFCVNFLYLLVLLKCPEKTKCSSESESRSVFSSRAFRHPIERQVTLEEDPSSSPHSFVSLKTPLKAASGNRYSNLAESYCSISCVEEVCSSKL